MNFERPGARLKKIAREIQSRIKEKPLHAAVAAVTLPLGILLAATHPHGTTSVVIGSIDIVGGGLNTAIVADRGLKSITSMILRPHWSNIQTLNLNS